MHQFWDKQPVPQEGCTYDGGKEIEKERIVVETPHKLPDGFTWCEPEIEEAYELINKYYVEDETFRLNYSLDTVKWVVEAPGYKNIGIRKSDTNELIGYISSVPVTVSVENKPIKMVQIDFLCVHPDHRTKRFAPMLISEVKRIANTNNIWQALYTAVTKIPTPITKSSYWHRFLNVKRLVKSGFYKTNRLREKYFELRGNSQFRKMKTKDIPKVTRILQNYFKDFKVAPVINKDWVKHWILPINSYVNDETDDFISFYDISYDRVDGLDSVKQAYAFYMVGDVYNDAFLIARNLGYDVFNTLDVGQETSKLEKLKFVKGTGHVYYYLFNWSLSSSISLEDIQVKLP